MTYVNLRNKKIDFLRGIAIIAVLILHFNISYHISDSALNKIFSIDFINAIASNGNYGVTMFFVISGFLITSASLERYGKLNQIDRVGFYIFRFARIMPCLLLALTVITILSVAHIKIFENKPNSTTFFLAIFSVITFWHNVLMEKIGYFNYCLNIFWSLSVEEIFYIMFPLVCLFLKRTQFIFLFFLALIFISPLYRSFYKNNEIVALYGYLSCFDAIALGCCSAILAKKIQLTGLLRNYIRYSAWLLIICVYFYSDIMENVVFGISFVGVGTAILLITSYQSSNNSNFFSRIIEWFGRHSYEIYLFHIIVLAIMKEIITPQSLGSFTKLLWMATFFILSVLISGAIAKYYSEPLNKKIRLLFFSFRNQKLKLCAPTYQGQA